MAVYSLWYTKHLLETARKMANDEVLDNLGYLVS